MEMMRLYRVLPQSKCDHRNTFQHAQMGSKDVYLIFIQSQTLFSHVPWTVSTQEKKKKEDVLSHSVYFFNVHCMNLFSISKLTIVTSVTSQLPSRTIAVKLFTGTLLPQYTYTSAFKFAWEAHCHALGCSYII